MIRRSPPPRLLAALAAGLAALGVSPRARPGGAGAPELGPGVAAVVGDQVVSSHPATQQWTVVRVRDRGLSASPPGPGTVPSSLVDSSTMIQFGLRAIQPLSLELGVRVNPRYGTWDPAQQRVVGTPAAAGTVVPLRVAPTTPTTTAAPATPTTTAPAHVAPTLEPAP